MTHLLRIGSVNSRQHPSKWREGKDERRAFGMYAANRSILACDSPHTSTSGVTSIRFFLDTYHPSWRLHRLAASPSSRVYRKLCNLPLTLTCFFDSLSTLCPCSMHGMVLVTWTARSLLLHRRAALSHLIRTRVTIQFLTLHWHPSDRLHRARCTCSKVRA